MAVVDQKYWNLAQAAAWMVYHERALVLQLAEPTPHAFGAIGLYPTMWPPGRRQIGSLSDLHRALIDGRLEAHGHSASGLDRLAPIPAAEWADLHLAPPFAYDARDLAARRQPWIEIRVLSSDAKKLWRSEPEVSARTKFDWRKLEALYRELRDQNPEIPEREIVRELQVAYEDEKRRKPPARSTIQERIKTWR